MTEVLPSPQANQPGRQFTPEEMARMFPDLADTGGEPIPQGDFIDPAGTATEQFPAVTGDTLTMPAVPDTSSAETNPAESKDTRARSEGAIVLGGEYQVRRKIQEGGTQSIKAWQWSKAKVANAVDSPGMYKRQFAHWRAERGLERRQDRLATARNSAQWQTRRTKVAVAQSKLDDRKGMLDQHTNRMEGRRKVVTENAEQRRKGYTNELIQKKQDALVRKRVRQESDLSRLRPRERRELNEILKLLPAERLDRMARAAIESHATTYRRKEAEKTEHWANKRQGKTEGRLDRTTERLRGYDTMVEEADRNITELGDELLSVAREHVKTLRAKLESLGENDPDYANLSLELQNAEGQVSTHNKSLQRWESVAGRNRRKSGRTTRHAAGVQSKLTRQVRFAKGASLVSEQWRNAELDDMDTLDDEVEVTLRPRRPGHTHQPDAERKAA